MRWRSAGLRRWGHAVVGNLKAMLQKVRSALMRRGRSRDDADDLVQEAWIRLQAYERQSPVREPGAFLMRAALNLSIDQHRSKASQAVTLLPDDVPAVDVAPSTEAQVEARQRLKRLEECLGRLNERTRVIYIEHRIEGLSYLEIARRHGLSSTAVERHVARATMQITHWMEGW